MEYDLYLYHFLLSHGGNALLYGIVTSSCKAYSRNFFYFCNVPIPKLHTIK